MQKRDLNYLCKEYDKLQLKYGDENLNSIYFGGCKNNPDICFVFMNPTKRNIASEKSWKGDRSPWIGTKNIWDLFKNLDLINDFNYKEIKSKKGNEWTEKFAKEVYKNLEDNKIFITNLAKCTQTDARALPDEVFNQYLELFYEEIEIVNPKIIILFGNQVSSIVLKEKISVSQCRKKEYLLNDKFKCYSVYYPVGNGRFNIDKSTEDIKWIIETN
jgi:Uracil DNA glycosylase superfamily.